jgi:hypothetical protein
MRLWVDALGTTRPLGGFNLDSPLITYQGSDRLVDGHGLEAMIRELIWVSFVINWISYDSILVDFIIVLCSLWPSASSTLHFSCLVYGRIQDAICFTVHWRPFTVCIEHITGNIFFLFIYFISNQNLQSYELICWRKSCDAQQAIYEAIQYSNFSTQPFKDCVRVRVTLRLAVYRQSVCLGDRPLETHDQ